MNSSSNACQNGLMVNIYRIQSAGIVIGISCKEFLHLNHKEICELLNRLSANTNVIPARVLFNGISTLVALMVYQGF